MVKISPDEFKHFIGDDIRLDIEILERETTIEVSKKFYMGKNTRIRQELNSNSLKVEHDLVEEK